MGDVKFMLLIEEFKPKFQYTIELFHFRVKFPELKRLKEYNPDRNSLLIVKFCEGKMVSVGLSKVDQTETLPFRRTKLPELSRAAAETPRPAVEDSQTTAEAEPLTRRRLPSERNWREAEESATPPSPPAIQTGTPP